MNTLRIALAALAMVLPGTTAAAATIRFDVSNVHGSTWSYQYWLTGDSLLVDQGFTVFFDEALYGSLQPLAPVATGWDTLVVQPDIGLQSPGAYDALALSSAPTFVGPFAISFLWHGPIGSVPAPQFYEIYQLDVSGSPSTIQTGLTSTETSAAAVPEPSSLLLVATGMLTARAVGAIRRRRQTAASHALEFDTPSPARCDGRLP